MLTLLDPNSTAATKNILHFLLRLVFYTNLSLTHNTCNILISDFLLPLKAFSAGKKRELSFTYIPPGSPPQKL